MCKGTAYNESETPAGLPAARCFNEACCDQQVTTLHQIEEQWWEQWVSASFFYKIVALMGEEGLNVKVWFSSSGGNSTVAVGYSSLQLQTVLWYFDTGTGL